MTKKKNWNISMEEKNVGVLVVDDSKCIQRCKFILNNKKITNKAKQKMKRSTVMNRGKKRLHTNVRLYALNLQPLSHSVFYTIWMHISNRYLGNISILVNAHLSTFSICAIQRRSVRLHKHTKCKIILFISFQFFPFSIHLLPFLIWTINRHWVSTNDINIFISIFHNRIRKNMINWRLEEVHTTSVRFFLLFLLFLPFSVIVYLQFPTMKSYFLLYMNQFFWHF